MKKRKIKNMKPLLLLLPLLLIVPVRASAQTERPFQTVPSTYEDAYDDMRRMPTVKMQEGEPIPLEGPVDREKYILGPGDHVDVSVWGVEPPIINDLYVSAEGRLLIPPVGAVEVGGISLAEAESKVVEAMKEYFGPQMRTTLTLLNPRRFRAYAAGAVKFPGAYKVTALDRVNDLLRAAGGIRAGASRRGVKLYDRDRVLIGEVDLLQYQSLGLQEHNPRVPDGGIVEVPAIGDYVMLSGKFPQIYGLDSLRIRNYETEPLTQFAVEFKEGETLLDLLKLTGPPEMPDAELIGNVMVSSGIPGQGTAVALTDRMLEQPLVKGQYYEFPLRDHWVFITGSTNSWGRFQYRPGWVVQDYLGQAGGPNWNGSKKIYLRRKDGIEIKATESDPVYPGDVIYVPEKFHVERYWAVGASLLGTILVLVFK